MSGYYYQQPKREKLYQPIQQKTLHQALVNFFRKEVPQIGGEMIIELVARQVDELVTAYCPKTEHITMGQMLWFAIDEGEKASYGKSMSQTRIKPVILTLIHPSDIEARRKGVPLKFLQKNLIARLYKETKEQGAVLAETDVSIIRFASLNTIEHQTLAYEKEFNVILPRRGTIHDMGRSLTHKKEICKKRKLELKSISQIARETNHTPESVSRYTTDLERIKFCLAKKLSINDISFVTKLSPGLVIEYINIIDLIKQKEKERKELEDSLPF